MSMNSTNEQLKLGIRKLTVQHQGIVELVNAARRLVDRGQPDSSEISHILDEMVRHSREHFELEESLMQLAGFPGLGEHRQLHQEFKRTTVKLSVAKLAGEPELPLSLLSYLIDWWDRHILEADKEYELFLAQRWARQRAPLQDLHQPATSDLY